MFETLGFETVTPRQAAVVLGLFLGACFGALAEITRFCLRRAVAGEPEERASAAGVWAMALIAAILGTQAIVMAGLVSFEGHRFLVPDMPWLAVLSGGLLFGTGMVLTRGCVSRLTVLLGTGNLRALAVLIVFAITAHATLKGVLSPIRTTVGSVTAPIDAYASLAALPGGVLLWTALLVLACGVIVARSGARARDLVLAVGIGSLVPLAWAGTGWLLLDDFDPIPFESLSTTSSSAETLFWIVASTSIPAGFGVGLIGGIVAGGAGAALLSGRFHWQSLETPAQTGRYLTGGALMGFGGVLAGGCTLGAGLSGVPTLAASALLALASIIAGGWLSSTLLGYRRPAGVAAE